jgi:hypothetical protein
MTQHKEDDAEVRQTAARVRKAAARFYDRVLSPEEVAALADLASNPSLADEIGLVRVLIRRKLEEGTDLADICKAVDALGRALKVQKQISNEGRRALQDALLAVLAEIGEQGEGGREQGVGSRDAKTGNKRRTKDVVVR